MLNRIQVRYIQVDVKVSVLISLLDVGIRDCHHQRDQRGQQKELHGWLNTLGGWRGMLLLLFWWGIIKSSSLILASVYS